MNINVAETNDVKNNHTYMEQDFDIRNISSYDERDTYKVLRPLTFDDFSGQEKIIENLKVFVAAAKLR